MGENNKILDVTYGNFSCRLEGFDDSVETMKSVVGYFHDLAGHNLFTDQAHAVPDLDVLARLAAQQTSGNVVIEEGENGLSLRVMTEDDAPEALDEADATAEASEDTAVQEEQNEDVVFAEDAPVEEVAFEEPEDTSVGEVTIDDISEELTAEFMEAAADAEVADHDTDIDDDAQVEDFAAEVVAPVETPIQEIVETSAADRLQRIRAVVGRGGPPARDDTYAEDLSEDDVKEAPKAVNPLAQRLAELAKRNSELMDADTLREPLATTASAPLTLGEEELVADVVVDAEVDDAHADVAEETADVEGTAHDDGVVEDTSQEIEADVADEAPEDDVEVADDVDEVIAEAVDDVEEEAIAARSERAEQPLLLTTRHQPITDVDDDDDFDLHEEVAKIEQEISARPGNELARHGLPRTVEDAMSRILMKTDIQLDLQETRDGRDAIAQLKAAVAATEAARQMGDAGAKSRDVSAMFRDDLGALEGTGGSGGSALPPLKLVEPINEGPQSSLREVAPLTEAAERLRKIAETSKSKSVEATAQTFADFARQQGAQDLVDKLEAAGAYLAYVEGENDFSRPQVMKVVQSASEDEVTREDGLRSFGRLLRQSRIIKLNNGRFQIAENTRFKPSGNLAARY